MSIAEIGFEIVKQSAESARADGLVLPVFQEEKKDGTETKRSLLRTPDLEALDRRLSGTLFSICEEEKFEGASGKIQVFRKAPADSLEVRRLVLAGLGVREKLRVEKIEKSIVAAVENLLGIKDMTTIAIVLPDLSYATIQAVVDAASQATYRSLESKEKSPGLAKVILLTSSDPDASALTSLKRARSLAKSRALVKDLVNMPSNTKTTSSLAAVAEEISKLPNVSVEIRHKEWVEANMPSFFTVAIGSVATDPPKFIRLSYRPGAGAKKRLAVIGKSVIFDTGGYQVKTDNWMNTMKGDMTGGAVALGTMRACAELELPVELDVYLAATPNKIDSHAMLPDSIINSTCGKKIEIRHTDAEGRLTLIDAVAIAAREKPAAMVTIATLTGSASRAVGTAIALMGNEENLRTRVEKAARLTGEPVQTLDVIEQDYEDIKSKLDGADIINTSQNKNRGAQSAAAFVMSGAPDGLPIAHLDIAGADMTSDEKATGIALKTVVQWVIDECT